MVRIFQSSSLRKDCTTLFIRFPDYPERQGVQRCQEILDGQVTRTDITMILTITETRKLLGDKSSKYTDDDLVDMINLLTYISDLIIDRFLAQRKESKTKSI